MPPLVFLPGAGGLATFWRPVADRLADLGPVHVEGYPGFGDVPREPALSSLDDLFGWLLRRLPGEPCHVIAQSMGGVLAARLAASVPERVARLVLVATSGGIDVASLGGADWRRDYRASLPEVPAWFLDDRTDLTVQLGEIRAPTLLVWGEADPISPLAVAHALAARIPDSRLRTITNGTHAVAHERPGEVAELIRLHLS